MTRKYSLNRQFIISLVLIVLTASLCFLAVDWIGYRAVALILLVVVSVNAILFDIFPVLTSALLSAVIWNYFFIPPIFTWNIDTPEDGLLFLMYFVIASINGVLTFKIREYERKANAEADKAKTIQLYNTLLNSLSHELRTPLSAIIGAVDILQEQSKKLNADKRGQLYTEIAQASFRLNRQLENLLNMSRFEAGIIKPKNDWTDLNESVYWIIRNIGVEAHKHNIEFTPNDNMPLCKLDRGMLEQILQNLLHNAIQYTPEQSKISVQVAADMDCCWIEVSDSGPGFPEKEMDLVFDKFYRIDHSVSGGTGLGLSIVKGFTEAMYGRVYLVNLATGGAKFRIEIPCEMSEHYEPQDE